MLESNESLSRIALTSEIVAAYVSNNKMEAVALPAFIQQIYNSLSQGSFGRSFLFEDRPELTVPIEESVQPDYIVCLEDGRRLKMLKRHLKTAYNLTPDQYRERWGLPSDYPMVAPNYAKRRSSLAKTIGLGTSRARRAGVVAA